MPHEDRRRAGSFGEDAERDDRARPSDPPALGAAVAGAGAGDHELRFGGTTLARPMRASSRRSRGALQPAREAP